MERNLYCRRIEHKVSMHNAASKAGREGKRGKVTSSAAGRIQDRGVLSQYFSKRVSRDTVITFDAQRWTFAAWRNGRFGKRRTKTTSPGPTQLNEFRAASPLRVSKEKTTVGRRVLEHS